jgi:hypothetical protein
VEEVVKMQCCKPDPCLLASVLPQCCLACTPWHGQGMQPHCALQNVWHCADLMGVTAAGHHQGSGLCGGLTHDGGWVQPIQHPRNTQMPMFAYTMETVCPSCT